jgi:hypothetical protein
MPETRKGGKRKLLRPPGLTEWLVRTILLVRSHSAIGQSSRTDSSQADSDCSGATTDVPQGNDRHLHGGHNLLNWLRVEVLVS